jgi:hypothetical protein
VYFALNLLLYTFNLKNSIPLIEELSQININPNLKIMFNMKNVYTSSNDLAWRIVGNGAIIIPCHDLEHSSRLYYRM